jgi:ankyrin repeat protein
MEDLQWRDVRTESASSVSNTIRMRCLLCCAVVAFVACSDLDRGKTGGLFQVPRELDGGCSHELLAALAQQDARAVKDLVARGAVAVCSKTSANIESAIRYNNLTELALLLDAGADPNLGPGEPSNRPYSLLLAFEGHAFKKQGLEATGLLLKHGANPNQRGNYSWGLRRVLAEDGRTFYTRPAVELRDATPLIAAALAGDVSFAKVVLEAGADTSAHDATGQTALDYAKKVDKLEMLNLLAHFSNPLTASVSKSLLPLRGSGPAR